MKSLVASVYVFIKRSTAVLIRFAIHIYVIRLIISSRLAGRGNQITGIELHHVTTL